MISGVYYMSDNGPMSSILKILNSVLLLVLSLGVIGILLILIVAALAIVAVLLFFSLCSCAFCSALSDYGNVEPYSYAIFYLLSLLS